MMSDRNYLRNKINQKEEELKNRASTLTDAERSELRREIAQERNAMLRSDAELDHLRKNF